MDNAHHRSMAGADAVMPAKAAKRMTVLNLIVSIIADY